MIVARTGSGRAVVVDRLREMVQLASGLGRGKKIGREVQERALACLARFGQRVRHMPPGTVRVVGTNTLRVARNAEAFVARAEAVLGHPVETVSGLEEARLIYLGVAETTPMPEGRSLVVDIGGGSTELIVGRGREPRTMESLYIGCVSMSRDHFPGGVIDADGWRSAEVAAFQELEPLQARFGKGTWDSAFGASGTVRAVSEIIRQEGWGRGAITPKHLRRLRDAMLLAGRLDRLPLRGLNAERRPVFCGGVAILAATLEALGIERLTFAEGGLREGLLHDLLGRIRNEDARSRSVAAIALRYGVDAEHAARVEAGAVGLFDQVAEVWGLDAAAPRQRLAWAARLHELGLTIAHSHHHRHGHYIVSQADLPGFAREEQELLAVLIRAHRRKFPASAFSALPRKRRETEKLAVLLRLAVVLQRSRNPAPLPPIEARAGKREIELRFPEGWLETHPLTRADLQQEAAYLRAADWTLQSS